MVGLGLLPGHNQSHAGAISPDGGWVVGHGVAAPEHWEAFAWSAGTGMFGLGDLPGGEHHSVARGVSHNGRVIVGNGTIEADSWNGITSEAFMWTQQHGMVGLGTISPSDGTPSSGAYDVSANGRVIVGYSTSEEGSQAFRWTPEDGMVGLGAVDPDNFVSSARAVSNNGLWTVGSSVTPIDDTDSAERAVLWTPDGEIIQLGWPQDVEVFRTVAMDVTNDGSTVVGKAYGRISEGGAFLWTPDDGMRLLSDVLRTDYGLDVAAMGWRLDEVTGISPDGLTLVGTGLSPDGYGEPYMVRLPAPASLAPLMAAGLLAAKRRR
ncbi:MAG: hypothetical protein IT431_04600 [Phycisphaerales bacterium]|nr:hypothetical protein [Phycisphaerales bacterium]